MKYLIRGAKIRSKKRHLCPFKYGGVFTMPYILWHGILVFVCVGVFVPLENFSLNWRRHHIWWRATNFYPYSALMAIELWGFFDEQHLLWHLGQPFIMVISEDPRHTPVVERLAAELWPPVLTTLVCPNRGLNPGLLHARRTLWPLHHQSVSHEQRTSLTILKHCYILLLIF